MQENPQQLAKRLMAGDRRALARAITLIESSRPEDRAAGDALLEQVIPAAGKALRLGISGVPGVGKSTFIESLGNYLIDRSHRVAVLAEKKVLTTGTMADMLKVDHPWVHEYFHGVRARAALASLPPSAIEGA